MHYCNKITSTSPNFTQVHPGEELIERFLHLTSRIYQITSICANISLLEIFVWFVNSILHYPVSCTVLELGVPPAHRKIFTLNTHHIYIKLHQSAPISLYLRTHVICEQQYLTVSCILLQLGLPPSVNITSPHLLQYRQY